MTELTKVGGMGWAKDESGTIYVPYRPELWGEQDPRTIPGAIYDEKLSGDLYGQKLSGWYAPQEVLSQMANRSAWEATQTGVSPPWGSQSDWGDSPVGSFINSAMPIVVPMMIGAGFGAGFSPATGAATGAEAGAAALTEAEIAAIVAAEGGYSALPAAAASEGMLSGAIARGAIQGAGQGAVQGAMAGENPLESALRGAVTGGAAGGAGTAAGGMFDDPIVSGAARGAAGAGTGAALSGAQNPWLSALEGGAMGGLTRWENQAPSLSDQEFDALMADINADLDMIGQPTSGGRPIQTFGESYLMQPGFMNAESLDEALAASTSPVLALEEGVTYLPLNLQPTATIGQPISDADFEAAATEEALTGEAPVPEAPVPEAPSEAGMKPTDYIKLAKRIYGIVQQLGFGQDTPEFTLPEFTPPEREEGQSDEEYFKYLDSPEYHEYLAEVSDLALDYLGLDADAMRAAGYKPGTQEYLDYILAQADKVIRAAFGDAPIDELAGQSVEDLQAAFRGKSEAETEGLLRALYTRGALGTLSFRESAINPFTGELEYLGMLPGEATGPTAGAQRGYARFLEESSRLTAPEARKAVRGMLGRGVDLFGLEKARKARELDARLQGFLASAPEDEEEDQYGRRSGRGIMRRAPPMPAGRGFWEQFRR